MFSTLNDVVETVLKNGNVVTLAQLAALVRAEAYSETRFGEARPAEIRTSAIRIVAEKLVKDGKVAKTKSRTRNDSTFYYEWVTRSTRTRVPSREKRKWAVGSGRAIYRDGKVVFDVDRAYDGSTYAVSPAEADALVRKIVDLLNKENV